MKTTIAEYSICGKTVMLMRKATKYCVRCANYRSKRCKDKIRYDFRNYSYNIAEGTKDGMKEIFWEECDYITDMYGEMNELEL